MKRLVIAVVALVASTTISFSQNVQEANVPFEPSVPQLSKYLRLSSLQYDQVASINDYFVDMQIQSIHSSEKVQDKKMYQAVYGNLKLMKGVLEPEQYHKYVTVLNITNNNKKVLNVPGASNNYLADLANQDDLKDLANLADLAEK